MLKHISIALFLIFSLSAVRAQDADNESAPAPEASHEVATPETDNAPPTQDSVDSLPVQPGSVSGANSAEIFTHRDGYCIRRVIHDNGFTRVTIDALGTLQSMKNNIVEDVEVACP